MISNFWKQSLSVKNGRLSGSPFTFLCALGYTVFNSTLVLRQIFQLKNKKVTEAGCVPHDAFDHLASFQERNGQGFFFPSATTNNRIWIETIGIQLYTPRAESLS